MSYPPWMPGTEGVTAEQRMDQAAYFDRLAETARKREAARLQEAYRQDQGRIAAQRREQEREWEREQQLAREREQQQIIRQQAAQAYLRAQNSEHHRTALARQEESERQQNSQSPTVAVQHDAMPPHIISEGKNQPLHFRWELDEQGKWVMNRYGSSAVPYPNGGPVTAFQRMQRTDNGQWAWFDIGFDGPTDWQFGPQRTEPYRLIGYGNSHFVCFRPCGSPSYRSPHYRTLIYCPKDRQALRVPTDRGKIRVACPCGHKWEWSPEQV